MEMCKWIFRKLDLKQLTALGATLVLTAFHFAALAQDGIAGINEANQKVRSYFDAGTQLMYAVGALVGLIGAVKVEQKIFNAQPLAFQLLAENKHGYIIEELCMSELTIDLRLSKFNYILSVLEEEFEEDFLRINESGLLTYEIINLIIESETVFETLGFTEVNEQNRMLRYAIASTIRQYLESK